MKHGYLHTLIFILLLAPLASQAMSVRCPREVPAFDPFNPGHQIGTFKAGTELTIIEYQEKTRMLHVSFPAANGTVIRALCRPDHLGISKNQLASTIETVEPSAESVTWFTDYSKALATASIENKFLLLNFSALDWNNRSMELEKEVFSTREFKAYAKSTLILVRVDFPKNKDQTAEEKKANKALAKQFDVASYPTIVIVTPDGEEADKVGDYTKGPDKFIEEVEKIIKKAPKRKRK
jgi:thioredoxin-related protein